jgi:hypothetical protein
MGCERPAGPTGRVSRALHCRLYHDAAGAIRWIEVLSFRDGVRFSIPDTAER